MTSSSAVARPLERHLEVASDVARSTRFDHAAALLGAALVAGSFLDLWAHHYLSSTLESFFTPWHALLYAALAANGALLIGASFRRIRLGLDWRRAVPSGYEGAFAGVLVFAVGGLADLVWHQIFGIEVDLEAAVSPSHLVLFLGGLLIVSGPYRAGWLRPAQVLTWGRSLPVLLSASFILVVVGGVTEYLSPFERAWPARGEQYTPAELSERIGLGAFVLQSAIVAGFGLLTARRWKLPFGSFALLLGLVAAFVGLQHGFPLVVPIAIAGGLLGDVAYALLRPRDSVGRARLFALALPALLFAVYVVGIGLTDGLAWSTTLSLGAVGISAAAGWLMSWLVLSPAARARSRSMQTPGTS